MSLIKNYDQKKPECKVTFKLSREFSNSAKKINLVGDFNNWDKNNIPMNKLKNGGFSVSVNLKKGTNYEFKYLIDGFSWQNEPEADKLVPNEFQGENSVVIV